MPHLALFLFGSPRFELDGEPVEINRHKAMALLAYLAVTGRVHSRDALAALLWPDFDQSQARGALRRTLSALNTSLPGGWLEADRETIALTDQAGLWVDIAQFRQRLALCQEHGHPADEMCAACVAPLTGAVELFADDFLAGFTLRDSSNFDDWQFFQAENLRRELAGALERLVRWHRQQGDLEPALGYARRWLNLDPLHEPAQRWLMELYAFADQRPAALRQYQEYVRILDEELGVAPSAETNALYERIRVGDLSRPAQGQGSTEESFSPARPRPGAPPFLSEAPQSPDSSPPFVARERELARLHHHLAAVLDGHGQVVFVTGEAGSGKTALVSEFAHRAQAACAELVVAMSNCNAHTGPGDPYLPFREILTLLTGDIETRWLQGLISRENVNRLWAILPLARRALVEVGSDLIDTLVPAAEAQTGGSNPVKRLAERQAMGSDANRVAQTDLFEQYVNVLQTLARQVPLLLVIDDAQWADLASINLLFHLGRRLERDRLLLVVAYRPDDVAVRGSALLDAGGETRHPLAAVVNELRRTYGDVQLDLSQAEGRAFVDALLDTQPNCLGESFRTALYRQTRGHPLFTVELLRAMQERGDLARDTRNRWVEGPTLNWETLPARVEAVIEERLGRLAPGLREILAVASVEGESFSAQVVARVQALGERQLLRELSRELATRHRLVREQGEIRVNGHFLSRYQFTHTIFQQYLYNSLSAGERRLLHGEVAAALEDIYAGRVDEVTVQLARHYTESGQVEKAIDYLLRAGDQARTMYAHRQAADFYQQALIFLREQRAYDRAARTLMKLGLTYHQGFDFSPARQAYAEGFTLWQQAGAGQPDRLPAAPHALRLFGSEPTTLDPALAGDAGSVRLIGQLFCGLLEQTPEMGVVPNVAQRWEVLAGGGQYIFHLCDDMRWSDGVPVTADDFVYAWRRVLSPATDSPIANLLYDVKGARAFHQGEATDPDQVGVQALNKTTLLVELEGPTSYFLQLLAHNVTFPIPRHAIEVHGKAWAEVENIVTNGPFRLESWSKGQVINLVRNLDYRGRATSNVERVELHFRGYPSGELDLYEADELDVSSLWFLSGVEVDRIRQRYANDYLAGPTLNTQYVGFDVSRPPFDDPRPRRALAMAIDKEMLADVILGGYAFPATGGFVPPGMPGHSPGIGLPYDPEQARRLLAEAGYTSGRGFPPVEWLTIAGTEVVMNYLQAQWAENLGLKLDWQIVDGTTFYDRLNKTPPHLFRIGWKADYPDPDNFLRAGSFRQQTRWQHDAYHRLVEDARRVTDQSTRMKLYQQADKILMEEAVVVPYLYLRRHQLVKPWVSRYPTSPLNSTFWKDVVIEPHP
ncbi:MAG: ABC transporter substrate-binding protein [Chloroflexota bacterium]